jgi:GDP-4-dehydro-6-deoxy-D-mannose reductase
MKVIITGAAGFIGGVLSSHCSALGCSVLGSDHKDPQPGAFSGAFERCDILDAHRVGELISKFKPDHIFHLAAQSYPTVSLSNPEGTMAINAGGTINIFESVRAAGISSVVVVACSSAEYGLVAAADLPVREDHPLRPLHPYGVSKVAQDLLAAQYFTNYGIPSVRIRIFNTTGVGKLGDVCSDLTKRAVEIEMQGRAGRLKVGNLTSRRAILDVRDLVRGLWLAAERGQPGDVYNVGASNVYSVQELIEAIRHYSDANFDIEQDPVLVRKSDEPVIAGDTTKFQTLTGWRPEIDLMCTVREMLTWWRKRLQAEVPAHSKQMSA